MSKKKLFLLDPILIVGLFISFGIGVMMVLIGQDTLSSFVIGLLSIIITLLIDVVARIERTENTFLSAARLTRVLLNKPISEKLISIIDAYELISKHNFQHYYSMADEFIDECNSKLCSMANGSICVEQKSHHAYGLTGVKNAQKKVLIVHKGPLDYWKSTDEGRGFYKANIDAVRRNVKFTRLFAISSKEIKKNLQILCEQADLGIEVIVVEPQHLDHEFVIIDDKIVVDFSVDETKAGNVGGKLESITLDPSEVDKKIKLFDNTVKRFGKSLSEVISDIEGAG